MNGGEIVTHRYTVGLMDTERLRVLIVEGHLRERHQSEDGTEIEAGPPALPARRPAAPCRTQPGLNQRSSYQLETNYTAMSY